ncbi:MAG: hypothetical protein ACD_41C00052G0003 [uncultured bacterium]|nr:MAG: hypothetical protein ACD_41C00052G0003 [uncultured bacterium]HBY73244.1 YraN family protein [Candidatus Kerfeldbacteria bacterium]
MYQRHMTGKRGEDQAVEYLTQHGYAILERNWFKRIGEIDIIARKGDVIYFFEVKTRSGLKYGHPFEAISQYRIRMIKRLGAVYVSDHQLSYRALAVGAIGIVGKQLTCLPNVDIVS